METPKTETSRVDYDVVVVGAGISGIGTSYWLQRKCPRRSFVVLEARESLGGTWSLFKYPGVRSDSDMFTFGYRFQPWQDPQPISSGANILAYLKETAEAHGIDRHIRYNHKLLDANWSDEAQNWTLRVQRGEETREIRCKFLSVCTGYYSYDEAHRPHFAGEESFSGDIALPQFWPGKLDYTGKRVVVVGSGATAVTMVPAMAAGGAAHVTMLQRSPTYILNLANRTAPFVLGKKLLPELWAYRLARWLNILRSIITFRLARLFPRQIKKLMMRGAAEQLPEGYSVETHFNPKYDPWDQRVCVVPDGDLFRAISDGKASVETDEIVRFTETGVELKSGKNLEADLIVLATGLKLQLMGGAKICVNGQAVAMNEAMIYKGMMVSDVPNLVYAFGYTNNSWTLKVDLTANYLCKMLNYMDRKGYEVVVAKQEGLDSDEPVLNLNSGYIQRAVHILPKQGKRRPWRVVQNYLIDMLATRYGRIADGVLQFRRKVT